MLKIGDTVKVVGKTIDGSGREKEYIPVGAICTIMNICDDKNDGLIVEICPKIEYGLHTGYWYLACDVEKGHMEWIKDE